MNLQRKVDLQEKHIQTLEKKIELLEKENQLLKTRNNTLTANESSVQLLQEQLKKDIESLSEIKGKYQQAVYDAQNLKKNFSQKFKKFAKEMKIDQ